MSGKNQFPITLSWQATDPSIGFIPNPNIAGGGSVPSGVKAGVMTGTNTIYSQITDTSRMDNIGLVVNWTGTPTGTFSVLVSDDGAIFSSLTFSPSLATPAGAAGKMNIGLTQFPYKFIFVQYVNASGSGVLTITNQFKDLN